MATDQTTRLEAATVKAENGSQIVYEFANGAATATVQTASGTIPTLAAKLAEISDTLAISAGIYPTTAAGLAATNNGQVFLVYASDDDDIIYRVYQNQNGTAFDTGKNTISGTDLEQALAQASQAATSAQQAADSVSGAAATINALPTDNGAAQIGYKVGTASRKISDFILAQAVTPQDYGTDVMSSIAAAGASGKPIKWPSGNYILTDTATFATDQVWVTDGKVTFTCGFASGSAVRPMFDFRGKITSFGDFTVDHKANTLNMTAPTVYQGNPISGSAVLVQGDWSSVEDWKIINAWDNGLSAIRLNPTTGAETPGSPKYGSFRNIKTQGCGVGVHTNPLTPGKIGAGIDIGSASAWTVSDCVDFQSYIGFILDVGAGAQCQFSNCVAWYTVLDSTNPTNGSGYGFYAGSSESSFVNCYSVGAGYRGWWIDEVGNDFVNCGAYIPQQEGVFIKCGQFKASFRIKGAGTKQANTYDAVLIDCSAKAITELELELHTTGNTHRYGVNATGTKTIDAHVTGSVTGTTGIINRGTFNIGSFIQNASVGAGKKFGLNRENPGFEWDVYGRMRASGDRANLSSTAGGSAFGDSSANGTVFVEDFATPAKRMAQGWDPVNDAFVTQSMHAGTAKKPYWINPAGGEVMAGQGTWDNPLRLGNYRLWFDTSGILRSKNGAPTSATDGTVVGTQTG